MENNEKSIDSDTFKEKLAKHLPASEFMPIHAELTIQIMREGKSVVHVCKELGRSKSTFYKWCKEFPELQEALEIGQAASEAFWQDLGQQGMYLGKDFNSRVYALQMVNRFSWRTKDPEEIADSHNSAVSAAMKAVQLAAELRSKK